MRRLFVSVLAAFAAASLIIVGCSQAAPPATPTPQHGLSPAAAEPTKPSEPTKTVAPEPTKPTAEQPTQKVAYPEKGKAITILHGFAAGGSADVGLRLLTPLMEKELGTPVQVINRTGAGGQIAFTELAKAKPDGYTLGLTPMPAIQSLYLDPERKATFNKDSFQPVAMEVVDTGVLAVKADSKFKTLQDVVNAARANPGQIKSGTAGLGTNAHMAVLLLQREAGIDLSSVHFDGTATEMTALLGGHIDLYSGSVGDTVVPSRSGQIRVLAVLDRQRNKTFMPDVPTAEEQGFKVYMGSARPIVGPAKMPKEIVDILSNSIKKSMQDPDFQKKMADQGLNIQYMDSEEVSELWTEFEGIVRSLMSLIKQQ